jgi:Tol biopolymer transport system component
MHLYSLSATTGDLQALTSGEYEVEQAALSPDGEFVVFSANKNVYHRNTCTKFQSRRAD